MQGLCSFQVFGFIILQFLLDAILSIRKYFPLNLPKKKGNPAEWAELPLKFMSAGNSL